MKFPGSEIPEACDVLEPISNLIGMPNSFWLLKYYSIVSLKENVKQQEPKFQMSSSSSIQEKHPFNSSTCMPTGLGLIHVQDLFIRMETFYSYLRLGSFVKRLLYNTNLTQTVHIKLPASFKFIQKIDR